MSSEEIVFIKATILQRWRGDCQRRTTGPFKNPKDGERRKKTSKGV